MLEIVKDGKFRYLFATAIVVLIFEIFGLFEQHLPIFVELPLFLAIILIIGRKVLWGGLQALLHLKFTNMYLLMTVAIIGAMLIGEFEEAAVIVALFSLSERLEDLGIDQSRKAIESLISSTPKKITLKSGAQKPIEDIEVGDIYVVKPGETIGLDGKVLSGNSSVNEAAITGEPLPSEKIKGSGVFAGSVNIQGFLEIRVEKKAEDSTLNKIIKLTESAANNKANYQQFIEKFSAYYTPAVFIGSILLVLIPTLLGQGFSMWFERGITLLVIACPCALVISTPISIFSAVGNASKKGILVKGGRFLEELANIKAIAFDKTRTLTFGNPTIKEVITYQGAAETDILSCAAGMESRSEHPMAYAVVDYAKQKGLNHHDVYDFQAIAGKGIKADCKVCNIGPHLLGNLKLLVENKAAISDQAKEDIKKIQASGLTPLMLADKDGIKGLIVVADEIRPESYALIAKLKQMHITTVILSGDQDSTTRTVAEELNVTEAYGNLLPEDKAAKLKGLKQQHGSVAMIGDGINDAPVLAASDVGIAMGAAGSDIAIETADIALMNDNIELLPYLIQLGKKTTQTIKYNVLLAILTKFGAIILTTLGLANLALAIFADVGVTIIVILLSLRLIGFKADYKV